MKKTGTVKKKPYYKKGFTGKSVKKNDTNALCLPNQRAVSHSRCLPLSVPLWRI